MTRGPVHVFQRALSNKFNYCSDCEVVLSFKRFMNTRYSWQKSRKMLQTGPKVIKYNFAVKKNSFLQTCFNWMSKWLTKLNYFNSWTSVGKFWIKSLGFKPTHKKNVWHKVFVKERSFLMKYNEERQWKLNVFLRESSRSEIRWT